MFKYERNGFRKNERAAKMSEENLVFCHFFDYWGRISFHYENNVIKRKLKFRTIKKLLKKCNKLNVQRNQSTSCGMDAADAAVKPHARMSMKYVNIPLKDLNWSANCREDIFHSTRNCPLTNARGVAKRLRPGGGQSSTCPPPISPAPRKSKAR